MERQGRAKMAELEPRWPKRAPRWSRDGQIEDKMEPTWLQDAKDVSTWADIVPILKKLHFPPVFVDFRNPKGASGCPRESQGRAKTAKLEPRWLQDGPRDRQDGQVGAKREPTWLQDGPRCAKTEPRERQVGAEMEPTLLQDAKDASTWADIVPILKLLHFPLVFPQTRSDAGANL